MLERYKNLNEPSRMNAWNELAEFLSKSTKVKDGRKSIQEYFKKNFFKKKKKKKERKSDETSSYSTS